MCTTALQRLTVAEKRMEEAVKLLNMVFLMNALSPVKFVWRSAPEERRAVLGPDLLGLSSQKVDFHGRIEHTIFLHSTLRVPYTDADTACSRMGTLLHEMIHA